MVSVNEKSTFKIGKTEMKKKNSGFIVFIGLTTTWFVPFTELTDEITRKSFRF